VGGSAVVELLGMRVSKSGGDCHVGGVRGGADWSKGVGAVMTAEQHKPENKAVGCVSQVGGVGAVAGKGRGWSGPRVF
jgi:hypothetical protein